MKLRYLLLSLGLVPMLWLVACQHRSSGGFVIEGQIQGAPDGWVFFLHQVGDSTVNDSAKIRDGHFRFTGHVDEPTLFSLSLPNNMQELDFFVENTHIRINGHADSLAQARVSGSPAQQDYVAYQQQMQPFNKDYMALYQAYEDAVRSGTLNQKQDSINAAANHIDSLQTQAMVQFIAQHPKSIVSAWVVTRSNLIYEPDVQILNKIYQSLDTSIRATRYGHQIFETLQIAQRTAIGQQAPDFTLPDTSGNPFSLSSLRGKYVLVDFWASWCGPCRMENPHVVQAYQKYKNKNFTILGVSLDKDRESWLQAIHEDHLYWHQVSDLKYWNSAAAKLYGVQAIPANFLLDPQGKIIARNLRGDALDKKLATIFSN
ncbi:MAG: AhpC/TSA family protein [Thermoflavifilum aggregans]|nr:AhpC/TSA family protein [Thermoflavifilum aggregans]